MKISRIRRIAATATATVAGGALMAGALTQQANAATFFRTVDSQKAGLQMSITSSQNNSPLAFVPRFGGTPDCATCGVPDTPPELTWSQVKNVPNATAVSLVNKKTEMCVDVAPTAQQAGAQPSGAKVVLAICDGTLSQQWKVTVATGNQSRFVNQLPAAEKLALTDSEGKAGELDDPAILEPVTVNNNLPVSERAKHIQNFGSTFVNVA